MSREKVYVVDEHDNVVSEKWRDETNPNDRIRIVGIWVENNKNQVLIAKRGYNMRLHPGLWGPSAAGGVTVGESYQESAEKEVSEELGVDAVKLSLPLTQIDKYTYGTNEASDGLRMLAVFRIRLDWDLDKFQIQPSEVAEIQWIEKSKLINQIKNKPGLFIPNANTWVDYLTS